MALTLYHCRKTKVNVVALRKVDLCICVFVSVHINYLWIQSITYLFQWTKCMFLNVLLPEDNMLFLDGKITTLRRFLLWNMSLNFALHRQKQELHVQCSETFDMPDQEILLLLYIYFGASSCTSWWQTCLELCMQWCCCDSAHWSTSCTIHCISVYGLLSTQCTLLHYCVLSEWIQKIVMFQTQHIWFVWDQNSSPNIHELCFIVKSTQNSFIHLKKKKKSLNLPKSTSCMNIVTMK